MFFVLSKVLDVFLSPYTWGVLLLIAATPWGVRGAKRFRRRRAFGVAALLVFIVAGLPPLPDALTLRVERAGPSTYRAGVTYDAVVLLGGIVDEISTAQHGQPAYNDSVERLIVTHRLLREGKARTVIVSAGTNPAFPSAGEAVVLARQLTDWGIAPERIIIEDRARNTRENAINTQAIATERGFMDVLVVTSAFHMARAAGCFAAIGMRVDTLPVDFRAHEHSGASLADWIPRADAFVDTSSILHEAFGLLVYRVRGYSKA